jgi:hypothetical protein
MRNYWFAAFLLILVSCGGSGKKLDKQTYQQSKKSLADKEKDNPPDFLLITSHDKRSLLGLGRQTIVKGNITNNASVCSYKEVRVKMQCYDKLGNRVEEHEDVLDDIIAPGQTADFRVHYKLPKTTDSIAMSVMSATAIVPEAKK